MIIDHAARGLRESATFDRQTIADIQRAAATGVYDIRGWGTKRAVPHLDDLVFLGASMSRYPLPGYRERCGTDVVLGDRNAQFPLHTDIPVTIAGMSFGALSGQANEAFGRGASEVGTPTTSGDSGLTAHERTLSARLACQYLPSRYGMNPTGRRKADAIEIVLGQGAKPGGGMLLGQKISARVAQMRTLAELGLHRRGVRLIVSGGIRSGADVAKALALGAALGPVPVFSDLVSLQYVRPQASGEILFGNTDLAASHLADPDLCPSRADTDFLEVAVEKMAHRFPGLTPASIASTYAGCCDVMPDCSPVISRTPVAGLIAAVGRPHPYDGAGEMR